MKEKDYLKAHEILGEIEYLREAIKDLEKVYQCKFDRQLCLSTAENCHNRIWAYIEHRDIRDKTLELAIKLSKEKLKEKEKELENL